MDPSAPGRHGSLRQQPVRDYGRELLAWALIIMALAAITPCVLLPQWRAYQDLQVEEQATRSRVNSIKSVVDCERRLFEATRDDPVVLARLARRELGYKQPGEKSVSVPVTSRNIRHGERPIPDGASPDVGPPPVTAGLSIYGYDAVFCHDGTRLVIMAMSVGLIGVALWLPSSRSTRDVPGDTS